MTLAIIKHTILLNWEPLRRRVVREVIHYIDVGHLLVDQDNDDVSCLYVIIKSYPV